jgi:hypothetical protein
MVEACWLLDASKCSDHGPGRTCKMAPEKHCWYKSEEAEALLKRPHEDYKEDS